METNYLCPTCGKLGEKHKRRNACIECVRAQNRQIWYDKKNRSIGGDEMVQSGALNGWQAVMSSEYLRRPLMVSV